MPAENTVIFCNSAGNGPIMSMPATGCNSLICWKPISASPRATICGRPARPGSSAPCPSCRRRCRACRTSRSRHRRRWRCRNRRSIFAASSARLSASADEMSGFGVPDFTATPIGDFTRSTLLSAIDLALLGEIVERIADHDQHVGGLAARQPHRNRVGASCPSTDRSAVSTVWPVARLEFRHQRLVGRRQSARDHHPDFGGAGCAGEQT